MLVFVCLISLILRVNKKMREIALLPIPSYNSTSILTFVFVPSFLFNRSVLFVVYFSVLLLLLLY